jgi:hypothetical protein
VKPFETLALTAWLVLAAAAASIAAGVVSLSEVETVKMCAFRWLTGIRCPGCGMAHALLEAFQGHWAASFKHHPFGLPLLAVWTLYLVRGFRPLKIRPAVSWAALAALLVFHGARLAGAAFDRRGPNDALPGFGNLAVAPPSVLGKPPLPPDLAAAAKKWGNEAQIAKLAGRQPGGSFRFAVIGDAEPGRFAWERVFAPGPDAFTWLLGDAQSLGADFVLQLGDMVSEGTEKDYRAHFKDLEAVGAAPLFHVIGNHDRSRPNGAADKNYYEAIRGKTDYFFDYGGWRFVAVDTSDRRLRSDQLAWLKTVVPANGRCVVFMHVPPKFLKGKLYSPKKKGFEDEIEPPLPKERSYWQDVLTGYFPENSDGFKKLMEERRVPRVYMGHVHAFGTAKLGPTLYVLSGGGGSPLYPLPPGEPKRKMTHWIEVTVDGDAVNERVHELGGDVYPMPLP